LAAAFLGRVHQWLLTRNISKDAGAACRKISFELVDWRIKKRRVVDPALDLESCFSGSVDQLDDFVTDTA
jgi:hypothetical protein